MAKDRVYAVVYYEPDTGRFGVDEPATLDFFTYGQYHCVSHDRFEPVSKQLKEDLKDTVGALLLGKSNEN